MRFHSNNNSKHDFPLSPVERLSNNNIICVFTLSPQLNAANAVEGSVDADITKLNTTLQESRFKLDVNLVAQSTAANKSVQHSQEVMGECEVKMNHTLKQGNDAHALLTGTSIVLWFCFSSLFTSSIGFKLVEIWCVYLCSKERYALGWKQL